MKLFFIALPIFLPNFATGNYTLFMKKILLLLVVSLAFSALMFSQRQEVIRIVIADNSQQDITKNRVPSRLPFECYYYPTSNIIDLSFLYDVGIVTVLMDNRTTGITQDYVASSSTGRIMIPVESDCAYRMDITIENGRSYYAVFYTGSDDFE